MYPVKTATAVTSMPAYTEGGTPGYFTSGNAVAGIPATVPGEHWFNMTQEELLNVIRAAGLTPSATDDTQLREAVLKLILAAVAGHNESGTAHADIRAALAGINIPAASEAVAGVIKQATAAQALAGTDDTTAMSPADVAAAIAGVVRGYTRQQYMAQESLLAVSGSLVIDLDTQAALSLQIVGGTVIANPEHSATQKRGRLMLAASAAHTLSWGSAWKSSSTVSLPTATIAGATIVLDYVCIDGTMYPLWMSTLGLILSTTDIAPLAAWSATGSASTGNLANLVDGNNATVASYSGGAPAAFVADFGATPRNLWRVRLGLNAGTINPMLCRLVYSDDGATWTPTNQSAISKALESAITDHLVDNYGVHRFWALQAVSGAWIQFTTVEFYPRIGG